MTPPDQTAAGQEAAILATERALAAGRYHEARQHIGELKRLHGSHHDIARLTKAVDAGLAQQKKRSKKTAWIGPLVAIVGYLILATRQPFGWTIPVWTVLAFLVVPGLTGYTVAKLLGPETAPGARFRSAMWGTGFAMFFYTVISLMIVRARIGGDAGSSQAAVVVFFVASIYTVLAGAVAGLVSAKLVWRKYSV
jgi:hypothetical protein